MEAAFGTRFPVAWLARFTGDQIRAVTVVGDYCRSKAGYCWASNETIATGLGLHERTVAALLRKVEGVLVECEHRQGGTIARRVEQVGRDVRAVWISAVARNLLSGTRFKVYSALSYREHLETTTSAKQLAVLCGLRAETARVVAAKLVAEGWVSRVGESGGAFRYTVHAIPLVGVVTQEALFAQPQQVCPQVALADVEEGEEVGGCPGQLDLFSLVKSMETPLVSAPPSPLDLTPPSPLVSAPQSSSLDQALVNKPLRAVGGCGSGEAATSVPRDTRVREAVAIPAVEPVPAVADQTDVVAGLVAASPEPQKTPSATTTEPTNGASALPPMTVSAEVHQVLRLVSDLVNRMNRWQQREAARAIGQAIREVGGDVERVAQRLERRYVLERDEIRDPYAWLAAPGRNRGLIRRGCHLPSCESGTDVELGGECQTCAYHVEGAQHRHAMRRQAEREQARTGSGTTPAPVPTDTLVLADQAEEQRPAYCDRHVRTELPCGLCAPLLDQPARPEVPRAIDGAELPPVTIPAWMTVDHSEGIAFREQLAARRRERELVGGR
ncbi:helix-turn-helix domain-containing protein [Kitasatospora aureofaciens]|uniref:helix-turn-helix domain-containing protein n=1 Tax=Kitasatospora aureofaciens TaxID=1894 RepID=UPI0033E9738D